FRNGCDGGDRRVEIRLAHLDGIDDGQGGLLLEGSHPTIPELELVVERIQDRRGVPLAPTALNIGGSCSPTVKGPGRIVAARTRDRSVDRQSAIEKELLPKRDILRRLRVVRGNGRYRLLPSGIQPGCATEAQRAALASGWGLPAARGSGWRRPAA